jgi:hypothetical protein
VATRIWRWSPSMPVPMPARSACSPEAEFLLSRRLIEKDNFQCPKNQIFLTLTKYIKIFIFLINN